MAQVLSSGGVGTLSGTLIGALIIGVINNGLDQWASPSLITAGDQGDVIVAAVLLDASRKKQSLNSPSWQF